MLNFIKKVVFFGLAFGILFCINGSFSIVSAETSKKDISSAEEKISHVPEITNVKILSTEKSECYLKVILSVSYEGEDLGTTVTTINHLIDGDGKVFFGVRDGKVIKKDKKQYEVQFSYAVGGAVSCSGLIEFITSVEDQNGNKSNSYSVKVNF